MIEGRFSPYTLLSAAWTYIQAALFAWSIPPSEVPLGLNSTQAYALIAPGLQKAFPGGSVGIEIAIQELPSINISQQSGIYAQATVPLAFFVTPAGGGQRQPAFTLEANASFSLGVGVSPNPNSPGSLVFSGTLAYLRAQLSLQNTTVGPVSVLLLEALVDVVLVSSLRGVNHTSPTFPHSLA